MIQTSERACAPFARANEVVTLVRDRGLSRTLDAGDFVHLEGDQAETISIVQGGQLLVEAYPEQSWAPTAIGIAGPGCLIGEEALDQPDPVRSTTIRALTTCRLIVISPRDLQNCSNRDRISELLLTMMADRTKIAYSGALASSGRSVDVRIGRWLLHMNSTFSNGNVDGAELAATQEHVASLAGTRRPTANRVLQTLQSMGFTAHTRGRVRILDRAGLEQWLEERDEE